MFARTALPKRWSLSVYIPFLLALTAVIPLLITISSIIIFLRPALTSQISQDMERDAQTRMQLIDTYLAERFNDIKTLSEAASIKSLLTGNQASRGNVTDVLTTTLHRDVTDYISLSLLDPQGNVVMAYPGTPIQHGNAYISPDILQQMPQSGKILTSDVFYDAVANTASIDLYARVVNDNFQFAGVIRASIGLHRLWEPVDSEPLASGSDSYAFVLDQHGVRIAYTNPDHSGFTRPSYLFKSVAPLAADFQLRIKNENLYGNNGSPVTTVADNALANIQSSSQAPLIFSETPAGQNQTFEVARYSSTVLPWTYFLLKPLNTVTGLANQQLLAVILIAGLTLCLVVFVGFQTGRGIALPIMRSVFLLRKNSLSLKTLSEEERVVATEQSWMVEASQVALQSIKYYTNATNIATKRLVTISTELTQRSNQINVAMLNEALRDILEATKYIEQAIKRQDGFNEKLTTALRVTNQSAEQINHGAASADAAATQLEDIVKQLMSIVGERDSQVRESEKNPS